MACAGPNHGESQSAIFRDDSEIIRAGVAALLDFFPEEDPLNDSINHRAGAPRWQTLLALLALLARSRVKQKRVSRKVSTTRGQK